MVEVGTFAFQAIEGKSVWFATLVLVVRKSLVLGAARLGLHDASACSCKRLFLQAWNKRGSFGRKKCRVSGCMCHCLWAKTCSNGDKIWKSWQFCGSDFSRFLATKMGVKSFYKKKLKGNGGRLHFFGSRFWLPDLVVRICSFFVFLSSCGFYFLCVQEEAKFTRLHV